MSNKVKDIDKKNAIFSMRNFDPDKIKIDEKSYKNILIYYNGYVTIKDWKYAHINSVNPLYLISRKWMDTLKKLMEMNI